MHFNPASFAIVALLGLLPAALAAPAELKTPAASSLFKRDDCTFTAYSGYDCDGDVGDDDDVGAARCVLTEGRHSFSLGSGCTGLTTIYFYTEEGCPSDARIEYQYTGPGCYTVNTGAHWASSLISYE